MVWIANGESGSSVRTKLNTIPNDGTSFTPVIETFTATGSQSSKTFSAIPVTYNELELTIFGRISAAADQVALIITLNGSSSNLYDVERLQALQTTVSATFDEDKPQFGGTAANGNIPALPGNNAEAGQCGFMKMSLLNYADTSFNKIGTYTGRSLNSANSSIAYFATGWLQFQSTGAITSLTVTNQGASNFVANTKMILRGII